MTSRPLLALALVIAACGGSANEPCPASFTEGAACGFADRCWLANEFSPCLSGYCTCERGFVVCDALAPRTGDACGDEPITSCTYEGGPSCDVAPTSEACACGDDGLWSCDCACYGGQSTCGDGCDVPPERLAGKPCGSRGAVCTYPGSVTCTCEPGLPGADPTFQCR